MSAGNPYQTRQVNDPGKFYGIASLFFSMIGISIFGLVLGIIGKDKSKKAGVKNSLATAGIAISIVQIVILAMFIIILSILTINSLNNKADNFKRDCISNNGVFEEIDGMYECTNRTDIFSD